MLRSARPLEISVLISLGIWRGQMFCAGLALLIMIIQSEALPYLIRMLHIFLFETRTFLKEGIG